ncbi:hypothetical protein ACP4OV_022694 [Aristida adscensionis]
MGRLFLVSLPATGEIIYRCKHCDTHLAYAADIISKMFRCKHGKAYLFDKLVNVNVGDKDERMMTTGLHTVCDIFCVACGSILGWKYLAAFEKSQEYKEGKFILESSARCWVLPRAAIRGPQPQLQEQSEEEEEETLLAQAS